MEIALRKCLIKAKIITIFTEFMDSLVTSCGFKVITNDYIKRETVNPKEGLCVSRVFIQGKYRKPLQTL